MTSQLEESSTVTEVPGGLRTGARRPAGGFTAYRPLPGSWLLCSDRPNTPDVPRPLVSGAQAATGRGVGYLALWRGSAQPQTPGGGAHGDHRLPGRYDHLPGDRLASFAAVR